MKVKHIFAAQCHFLLSAVSTITGIELSYRTLYLRFFVFLQNDTEPGGHHIVSIRQSFPIALFTPMLPNLWGTAPFIQELRELNQHRRKALFILWPELDTFSYPCHACTCVEEKYVTS
jgi:hypothetical protein